MASSAHDSLVHTCCCRSLRSFSALSVSGREGRNLNMGVPVSFR